MDSMKDHAASAVSDEAFAKRAERWPENTPDTKEAYLIREIFDSQFSFVFKRLTDSHLTKFPFSFPFLAF